MDVRYFTSEDQILLVNFPLEEESTMINFYTISSFDVFYGLTSYDF